MNNNNNNNTNKTRVIVNPGGSYAYLDNNNPYSRINNNTELLLQPIEITLPNDLMNKALKIEQMNCSIRFICLTDLLLGFYYYYINIFIGIFSSIASFNGYLSTIYYKRSLMLCYVIYQYTQIFARIANIIFFMVFYNQQHVKGHKQNQNTTIIITSPFGMEDKVFNIIILNFLLISQILIAFFVSQYYYLLPSKKDRQRITHSSSL